MCTTNKEHFDMENNVDGQKFKMKTLENTKREIPN